jgi:hypothetical protein
MERREHGMVGREGKGKWIGEGEVDGKGKRVTCNDRREPPGDCTPDDTGLTSGSGVFFCSLEEFFEVYMLL